MEFLAPLNMMLTDIMGPLGPLIAYGTFGIFMILAAGSMMFAPQKDPLDKFRQEAEKQLGKGATRAVLRENSKSEKLNKYAQFLEPQDSEEMGKMRKKMMMAGYNTTEAVRMYYLAQMALGVGGLVVGVGYYFMFVHGDEATTQDMILHILAPLVVGYYAPKYWLNKRTEKRKEEIQDGFPDSLDMMLTCVEAGQSMDQSIVKVASELQSSYPQLAQEFAMVAHEIKAGKDKPSVLNDMADRCDIQDISSFVTVLNQSQSFGTPVADALRVYASEMRDKRVMRAEEKANQLPTKMTLCTMALTVPPLLIILVGPSVGNMMNMGAIAGDNGQGVSYNEQRSEGREDE